MDGWVSSTKTMLGSVNDQRVKTSSISYVTEQLRNMGKEAYMPQVVSIGPLHRQTAQTRRELLYMEEIKWRCMRFLLFRTPKPDESLKNCSKAIYVLDDVVRAAYTDHIKLNDYDLAKIMLLDGCFLLELLISCKDENQENQGNQEDQEEESPGAEVRKMELVLSDLKLLENQIPFFILTVLYETLFLTETQNHEEARKIVNNSAETQNHEEEARKIVNNSAETRIHEKARKIVNNCALSLFGSSSKSMITRVDDGSKSMITRVDDGSSSKSITPVDDGSSSKSIAPVDDGPNCAHFLELVHWFMTREDPKKKKEDNHDVSITVDGNGTIEPKHCAARLEAVGVTIAPLDSDRENGGINSMSIRVKNTFRCDKKFSKTSEGSDKLEIQPLHITETTEVLWRNLIAWEQNRIAHEKLLKVENRTRCKFSQYALLFRDLICCEHDVQLLKERKVLLIDEGKRSNEEVMNLLRKIATGIEIDTSSGDGRFGHCTRIHCSGGRGNCRILWHRCRCIATSMRYTFRDMFVILKRDHTPTVWKTLGVIAAIVLLGLTIAQTILAAISL